MDKSLIIFIVIIIILFVIYYHNFVEKFTFLGQNCPKYPINLETDNYIVYKTEKSDRINNVRYYNSVDPNKGLNEILGYFITGSKVLPEYKTDIVSDLSRLDLKISLSPSSKYFETNILNLQGSSKIKIKYYFDNSKQIKTVFNNLDDDTSETFDLPRLPEKVINLSIYCNDDTSGERIIYMKINDKFCHQFKKDFFDNVKNCTFLSDSNSLFTIESKFTGYLFAKYIPPRIESIRTKDFEVLAWNNLRKYTGDVKINLWNGSLYRPKTNKEGYYSLGDHGGFGEPELVDSLMVKKGEYVKEPRSLYWEWTNEGAKTCKSRNKEGGCTYRPRLLHWEKDYGMGWKRQINFTDDDKNQFICLGDFVDRGNPNIHHYWGNGRWSLPKRDHPHVCIRKDCLEEIPSAQRKLERIYHDKSSSARYDGSMWTFYNPRTSYIYRDAIGYPGEFMTRFSLGHGYNNSAQPYIIKEECLKRSKRDIKIDENEVNKKIESEFTNFKNKVLKSQSGIIDDTNRYISTNEMKNTGYLSKLSDSIQSSFNKFQETDKHNQEMDKIQDTYLHRSAYVDDVSRQLNQIRNKEKEIIDKKAQSQQYYNRMKNDMNDFTIKSKEYDQKIKDLSEQIYDKSKEYVGYKKIELVKPIVPDVLF